MKLWQDFTSIDDYLTQPSFLGCGTS